jgi:hypothetical protein
MKNMDITMGYDSGGERRYRAEEIDVCMNI